MSCTGTNAATPPMGTTTVDRIDCVLPQTQCTRCGYPDCRGYAQAIAEGSAGIDRCPPGGAEGIARLAAVTGLPVVALDQAYGQEGPRQRAVIDEAWCIGCTLCLDACPTDAILGRNKRMHTVVPLHCTGCELCVPVCPVDCIAMVQVTGAATGWDAWSQTQADVARQRYRRHVARSADAHPRKQVGGPSATAVADQVAQPSFHPTPTLMEDTPENSPGAVAPVDPKRAMIEAAMRRARALRG